MLTGRFGLGATGGLTGVGLLNRFLVLSLALLSFMNLFSNSTASFSRAAKGGPQKGGSALAEHTWRMVALVGNPLVSTWRNIAEVLAT